MILMAEPLTDNMRALGKEHLLGFRMKLWHNADEVQFGLIPPAVFLPDVTIKEILDNYALLHSVEDLDPIIKNHRYLILHREALWQLISTLEADFIPLRRAAELDNVSA
jgi:hypothetical protein